MKFLIVLCLVGVALALPERHRRAAGEATAAITDQKLSIQPEGNFEYNYDTANGISARASGTPEGVVTGSYSWTSPEGKLVTVEYTADENGFHPKVTL